MAAVVARRTVRSGLCIGGWEWNASTAQRGPTGGSAHSSASWPWERVCRGPGFWGWRFPARTGRAAEVPPPRLDPIPRAGEHWGHERLTPAPADAHARGRGARLVRDRELGRGALDAHRAAARRLPADLLD